MKKSPKFLYPLVSVGAVVIGAIAFLLVMKFGAVPVTTPTPEKTTAVTTTTPVTDVVTASSTVTGSIGWSVAPAASSTDQGYDPNAGYFFAQDQSNEQLVMAWSKPARRSMKEVLSPTISLVAGMVGASSSTALQTFLNNVEAMDRIGFINNGYSTDTIGLWEIGSVSEGQFKGSTLYYRSNGGCDLGGCNAFHILVSPDKKQARILDGLYISDPGMGDAAVLSTDGWKQFLIPAFGLTLPSKQNEVVYGPDGNALKLDGRYLYFGNGTELYSEWLENGGKITSLPVIGKTKDGREIYEIKGSGCVLVLDEDGFPIRYASVIPTKKVGERETADIILDAEHKNIKEEYSTFAGGCDPFCPNIVATTDIPDRSAFVHIGKTQTGGDVFAPKDPASNQIVQAAYDTYFAPSGVKPSFQAFLEQRPAPVLFWTDAFGRWVKYTDVNVLPQGECGKPVIYLYPQKTQSVSVQLPSFIHVTKSEPTYPQKGWKVVAQPSGALTMSDGSQVDSLFWEGTGVSYVAPKDGFVVKDGDVKTFLATTLARYGLNEKESRDFQDFWVPKMVGAPYYRVSFLTSDWSTAAPLSVFPQPATSIRLFMDWQKLNAPILIEQPTIHTPSRNGFTLVEWGGLLYN